MGLFDDLAVGIGLKTRETADYSDIKRELKDKEAEAGRSKNKAFGTASSVYDNANAQRDFTARSSLRRQINNLRGLNPAFAEVLKANLTQRLVSSQQLRRQQAVSSLGLSIQDREQKRADQHGDSRLNLGKAEVDDKAKAELERSKALQGAIQAGATAYATAGKGKP